MPPPACITIYLTGKFTALARPGLYSIPYSLP